MQLLYLSSPILPSRAIPCTRGDHNKHTHGQHRRHRPLQHDVEDHRREVDGNDGYSGTKGLGVGKSINSSTFTAGGHSWYIAFFPDGEDEDCADWVSVSLYLDRPCAKDMVVVKARFDFILLDKYGSPMLAYTMKRSLTNFSMADGGVRCSGYKKFIREKEIENQWWLNDCFWIRCDVTVVKDIRVETTVADYSGELPSPDWVRISASS